MKPNTYIVMGLLLLFAIAVTGQSKTSHFYYYKNEKVPLVLNKEYVYIVTRSNISSKAQLEFSLDNGMEITKFAQSNVGRTLNTTNSTARQSFEHWVEVKLDKNAEYTTQINRLKNNQAVALVAPYFKNKSGEKIGLSNYFYVKLRNKNDLDLLLKVAKSTKTEIVGQNRFMPLWYTLKCTENSYYNALQATNFFYESGSFVSSKPSFMFDSLLNYTNTKTAEVSTIDKASYLVPNDPLYGNQWGLNNTGQNGGTAGIDIHAEDAWDINTGDPNVVVAVLDHGFEMNHPDLTANTVGTGFDTVNGSTPSVVRGSHGTACAGIVGATQDNNTGVSGVAPNTGLMSISSSLVLTPNIEQELADGINWAWQNGADVISNSWGSDLLADPMIDDAITDALANGRGGLGTIVVFSSGNNNSSTSNYPGNSNPNILNVGAIDRCGIRSGRIDIIPQSCDPWCTNCQPGSAFGATLDVVAPGTSVSTTDRQGTAGYDNGSDYTDSFGGTSAACPFVAGVAALVLSVNPNLTVQEVNDIIEQSTQKVGGYSYQNTAGRPNGTWNNEMGYGLVDAHAAVLLAQDCEADITVNQNVSGGTTDKREASQSITTTNIIFNNATAIYHAGNQVLLQPGFHARSGSSFRAYIEGCSGIFQARTLSGEVHVQNSVTNNNSQNDAQTLANRPEEAINDQKFVIFPNPFTDIINFKYIVQQTDSPVLLKIFNFMGEEVQTLVQEQQSKKGTYHVQFNGSYLPEGIYFYRLKTGDIIKTGKIILEK